MKNIYTILDEAGFSPSEQKVYIAGVGLPKTTSSELVRISKLPRQTVMSALQNLREVGLCSVQQKDGRSFSYTMQPLQNLKAHLGQKIRKVEALLDDIEEVQVQASTIKTQTGVNQEELENFLELALRCRSRQWRIIAPKDNALRHLTDSYINYFKKLRSKRQITSQTLWENTYSSQTISLVDTLMRKPRYLPKNFDDNIPAILLSFDDSLLVISGLKHPSSVLITNKEAAASFNIVFDLAWQSCREK